MLQSLSTSTRFLIAFLLVIGLILQFAFAGTRLMGQVYAHNGRIAVDRELWSDAIWYYDHAIGWYPYDHHWWFGKGQAHQGLRDLENTVGAFNEAHALAPHHVSSIASLAYEVRDAGNPEEIRDLVEKGLALAPHFWTLHYTDGLLRIRTGERDTAGEPLSRAQRFATQTLPLVEKTVAFQALATGNLERAEYAIEKSIRGDSSMPESWQLRGQIQHSMGTPEAAVPSYQRAINLYTERMDDEPETAMARARLRGETQAYLAFAHAALDQDEQAIEQFIASTTQYVDIAFFGESIDAIHERLVEGDRANRAAWANVLSAAGRHEAAMTIFRTIEQVEPESLTTLDRYYWANSLRHTGDPMAALEQYKKMPSMTWADAMAYAETLEQSGQPAAAQFQYNRILNMLQLNPQQRQLVEQRIAALGQ